MEAISSAGLESEAHRLRDIFKAYPVDRQIGLGGIGEDALAHDQRAVPDPILIVHEHGRFDENARDPGFLQRALDIAAAIMGGQIKIVVRDEASGVEDDLLQPRPARALGDLASEMGGLVAIEFEGQVEGGRVLPGKGLRHRVGIGDVGEHGRQIGEGGASHRILAPHPGGNGKAMREQFGDQRLPLIGWRADHADLADGHKGALLAVWSIMDKQSSEA